MSQTFGFNLRARERVILTLISLNVFRGHHPYIIHISIHIPSFTFYILRFEKKIESSSKQGSLAGCSFYPKIPFLSRSIQEKFYFDLLKKPRSNLRCSLKNAQRIWCEILYDIITLIFLNFKVWFFSK